MNLEKQVPELELCRDIPDGCFEDSAFAWWQITPFEEWQVVVRSTLTTIPAPTLQEILENSTTLCVTPEIFHAHKNYWTAQGETLNDEGMYQFHHGCSHNPATAALKLYLKLKGIEYEK